MSSVNVENLLYEEVGSHYEYLHDEKLGTEERKAAFNELDRLMDKVIELERIEVESKDKAAARESEERMKKLQMEHDIKDLLAKIGIEVGKVAFTAIVTLFIVNKSLKFEETGTVTTMAGRWSIQKGLSMLFK